MQLFDLSRPEQSLLKHYANVVQSANIRPSQFSGLQQRNIVQC